VNRAEVADAYERFETVMRKPIVTLTENDCLLFNDGTDDGFRYPVAKIDPEHPLWDLFPQPWFSEQHARAVAPLVGWHLDLFAKGEMRDADRYRGLA
jgi:hypothetical protein